jgi:hypothetical protein
MISRKDKRFPFRKTKNHPNSGDMKGKRIHVIGTVNEIKRILDEAGITYKKVRHSGFHRIVEVIFTHNHRLNSPGSLPEIRKRIKWRLGCSYS